MVKEIPQDVKEILAHLSGPQQVVLRKYIATLRADAKELEAEILALKDHDPHAHYHGEDRCTSDHGHGGDHHHGEEESHGHDHGHKHGGSKDHGMKDAGGHPHSHQHGTKEAKKPGGHSHGDEHHSSHSHKDHESHGKHESHDHSHKHESHDHGHAHKEDETKGEMPAWKKRALESGANDPMAAPFGGTWGAESSMSATEDKMQE